MMRMMTMTVMTMMMVLIAIRFNLVQMFIFEKNSSRGQKWEHGQLRGCMESYMDVLFYNVDDDKKGQGRNVRSRKNRNLSMMRNDDSTKYGTGYRINFIPSGTLKWG